MAETGHAEQRDDRHDRLAEGLARLRRPPLRPLETPPREEPPATRQDRRRWLLPASAALALVVAGGIWAVTRGEPGNGDPGSAATPAASPAVTPGTSAQASAPGLPVAPADNGFLLGGYVRARREIHVGSAVSGVVAKLYVTPGSRVTAGDKIAELRSDTLKAQVAGATAAVEAREAQLAEMRAGALPEELRRGEARLSELEVESRRAADELRRIERLAAEGVVSASEHERAEQDAAVAAARARAAAADLALLRQGPRPERIRQAQADLAQARATLELAQAQLEQTVIRSPIAGVVTQQHAEVGELVSAGFGGGASAALVTLADISELVVEIDVPHAELPRIRLGEPVRVESEALSGRRYEGHVSWIGPEANRQKLSVPIEIAVAGDTAGLLPGLSAKVTFLRDPDTGEPPGGQQR